MQVEKSACRETLERPWGNPCDTSSGLRTRSIAEERGRGLPGTRTRGPHACAPWFSLWWARRPRERLVQCEIQTAPPLWRHLGLPCSQDTPPSLGTCPLCSHSLTPGAPDPLPAVHTCACLFGPAPSQHLPLWHWVPEQTEALTPERPESVLVSIGTKRGTTQSPKAGGERTSRSARPTQAGEERTPEHTRLRLNSAKHTRNPCARTRCGTAPEHTGAVEHQELPLSSKAARHTVASFACRAHSIPRAVPSVASTLRHHGRPPGSPVHGILQASTPQWGAFPFSEAISPTRD